MKRRCCTSGPTSWKDEEERPPGLPRLDPQCGREHEVYGELRTPSPTGSHLGPQPGHTLLLSPPHAGSEVEQLLYAPLTCLALPPRSETRGHRTRRRV